MRTIQVFSSIKFTDTFILPEGAQILPTRVSNDYNSWAIAVLADFNQPKESRESRHFAIYREGQTIPKSYRAFIAHQGPYYIFEVYNG